MADEKLSQLPSGTAIADADLSYWDQSAASVSQPASAISTYTNSKLPLGSATQRGIVEVDGTTITALAGTISAVQPSGANPSATAGPTAVNGTAATFLRSDGAPAVQKASASQFGIVEVDGTSITASAGVISATSTASTGANPTATAGPTAVNGSATTFMRSDAAPAVQKASAAQFGIVEVDGTTITALGGVITSISGFKLLSTDTTFFIRTAPSAVTFTTGTPGVVNWTSHGLSAGDPVVFSLPYNRQTCTISVASPAVVTSASGGFVNGDCVSFGEVGALPTGVVSNAPADPGGQIYFVINQSGSTFNISATSGGSAINTTGSTSGIIYVSRTNPFGSGNGGILNSTGDVIEGQVYYVLASGLTANSFEISYPSPGGSAIHFGSSFAPNVVAQTGNDSNNGSAATRTGAFLTAGGAYRFISSSINFNGFNVTMQCADGTYYGGAFGANEDGSDGSNVLANGSDGVPGQWFGGGTFLWEGNTGNPSNVVWRTQSDAMHWNGSVPGQLSFDSIRTEPDNSNNGLTFDGGANDITVVASNIHFAGGCLFSSGGGVDDHVFVNTAVQENLPAHISGTNQVLSDAGAAVYDGGVLARFNQSTTLIGVRTFTSVLGDGAQSSFHTWAGPTPNAQQYNGIFGFGTSNFNSGFGTDVPGAPPVLNSDQTLISVTFVGFSKANLTGVIYSVGSFPGAIADPAANYQQPSTGFSLTLGDGDGEVILDPAGGLLTGTVKMPANPQPGHRIKVRTSQTITTLTVSSSTNQTLAHGAPVTLAAGTSFSAIFRVTNATTNPVTGVWYFGT